jgi:hypothetical protein
MKIKILEVFVPLANQKIKYFLIIAKSNMGNESKRAMDENKGKSGKISKTKEPPGIRVNLVKATLR